MTTFWEIAAPSVYRRFSFYIVFVVSVISHVDFVDKIFGSDFFPVPGYCLVFTRLFCLTHFMSKQLKF